MKRIVFGVLIVALGAWMALQRAGVVNTGFCLDSDWQKYVLPVIFILIGMGIITRHSCCGNGNRFNEKIIPELKENDRMIASVAFAGNKYNLSEQNFYGAKFDVFCGGVQLDLREAEIADNCEIYIQTFLGGVEILAPEDVSFQIYSNCLLGGVGNQKPRKTGGKTIVLKAKCMMGGVGIK